MTDLTIPQAPRASLRSLRRACVQPHGEWAVAALRERLKPAEPDWIAGAVSVLLSHGYERETSDVEAEALMEDWLDVLDGLSEDAIRMARVTLMRRNGRKRPMPGELWALAAEIDRETRRVIEAATRRDEPAAPIDLDARRANAAALAERYPHLVRRITP